MALVADFLRKPADNGDNNAWAPYANRMLYCNGIGGNDAYLYNNAGALYLSKGFIGIDDGTVKGSTEVTTAGEISIGGLTVSQWAKIEMAVSGTTATFTITSTGDANPAVLPASFISGYDGAKLGFYITSTKRCIGLAWINSAGALEGIVNTFSGRSYQGYSQSNDALDTKFSFYERNVKFDTDEYIDFGKAEYVNSAGVHSTVKVHEIIIEIGDWDMSTATGSATKSVTLPYTMTKIVSIQVFIRDDTTSVVEKLDLFGNAADPNLLAGGITGMGAGNLNLARRTGGHFDGANYNATSYNRGWVVIRYYE